MGDGDGVRARSVGCYEALRQAQCKLLSYGENVLVCGTALKIEPLMEALERSRSDSTGKERDRAGGEQESEIFSPQLYAGSLLKQILAVLSTNPYNLQRKNRKLCLNNINVVNEKKTKAKRHLPTLW